jgi:hypothetical protein
MTTRPLLLLWLLSWAVYALYFQGQWVFGQRPIIHITGDEPHYLVIATSLVRDGDLDVLDEYRDKAYLPFYPYHLGDARSPEDMHAIYGQDGHLYSKHGIGLPLLILPALRLGGHGLVILFMMGVAATLSVQTLLLARDVVQRTGVAVAAWVAVAFTSPLLLYGDQIYPEVPGALLTVLGVRAVLRTVRARRAGGPLSPGAALQLGLAVGLLPWLHLRYIPLAAVLALAGLAALPGPPSPVPRLTSAAGERRGVALRQLRPGTWDLGPGTWDFLVCLLLPPLLLGLALLVLDWRLFGGLPAVDEYGTLAPLNVLTGTPGLLLDRQFGLLVYSPVYLVALYGLVLVPRRLAALPAGVLLVTLGVYALFVAAFSYWYGAYSPPSRMLVPVAPLLVVPLALALERWTARRFRATAAGLLLLSWSIAHLLLDVPRLRYNLPTGESELLRYLSTVWGRDLRGLLPTFVVPGPASYAWAAAAALVAVALGLGICAQRPPRPVRPRARPGPAPPGLEGRPLPET